MLALVRSSSMVDLLVEFIEEVLELAARGLRAAMQLGLLRWQQLAHRTGGDARRGTTGDPAQRAEISQEKLAGTCRQPIVAGFPRAKKQLWVTQQILPSLVIATGVRDAERLGLTPEFDSWARPIGTLMRELSRICPINR